MKQTQHDTKKLMDLFQKLKKIGFDINTTKKCVKIIPPKNIKAKMYIAHPCDKGFHPVRRYLKNECLIDYNELN